MDSNAAFWKRKSTLKSKEIKALKKRIKEISDGREHWKSKSKENVQFANKYKKELDSIKKKIENILIK